LIGWVFVVTQQQQQQQQKVDQSRHTTGTMTSDDDIGEEFYAACDDATTDTDKYLSQHSRANVRSSSASHTRQAQTSSSSQSNNSTSHSRSAQSSHSAPLHRNLASKLAAETDDLVLSDDEDDSYLPSSTGTTQSRLEEALMAELLSANVQINATDNMDDEEVQLQQAIALNRKLKELEQKLETKPPKQKLTQQQPKNNTGQVPTAPKNIVMSRTGSKVVVQTPMVSKPPISSQPHLVSQNQQSRVQGQKPLAQVPTGPQRRVVNIGATAVPRIGVDAFPRMPQHIDDSSGVTSPTPTLSHWSVNRDVSTIKPTVGVAQIIHHAESSVTKDASHSKDEVRKINSENLFLLSHLQEINRKGGQLKATMAPNQVKHVAGASIQRKRAQRDVQNQNMVRLLCVRFVHKLFVRELLFIDTSVYLDRLLFWNAHHRAKSRSLA
jgi:hypothetical protein